MKPAAFKISGTGLSRPRFNPANAGSLGTTAMGFEVSAPGRGTFAVYDEKGPSVFSRNLEPFDTWVQQALWNGKDNDGEIVPDRAYTMIVEASSLPWDDSPPVRHRFISQVLVDSARVINPLGLFSGKAGLLYTPLPSLLP
jgi:hypothetical protein